MALSSVYRAWNIQILLLCIGPTNMIAVLHPSRNIKKQEEEQSL